MSGPALPPFEPDTQTLEQAVQEHLDHAAQLKVARRQISALAKSQSMLAVRQDAIATLIESVRNEMVGLRSGFDSLTRKVENWQGDVSRCLAETTTWGTTIQTVDQRTKRTHDMLEKFIESYGRPA